MALHEICFEAFYCNTFVAKLQGRGCGFCNKRLFTGISKQRTYPCKGQSSARVPFCGCFYLSRDQDNFNLDNFLMTTSQQLKFS